jgi:hypothetical protein
VEIKIVFKMEKPCLLIVTFLFAVNGFLSFGQTAGLKSISPENMRTHLEFLASDSLMGRAFGTPVNGLDIAADYLAENAAKAGLKPGVPGYLQDVPVYFNQPDTTQTKLTVLNGSEIIFSTDSVVSLSKGSESIVFSGEPVFAGFGWVDSISGYNDFNGIDIKGKVVLCSTGAPAFGKPDTVSGGLNIQGEIAKTNRILDMGAKGVILMMNPRSNPADLFPLFKAKRNQVIYSLKIPKSINPVKNCVVTTPAVFDALSGKPGSLEKALDDKIENLGQNTLFSGSLSADVSVIRNTSVLKGKNIVGVIEGADPKRRGECVVFMAHYDHLGISDDGDVYNGADDNGSGDVTILEIAKAFMSPGIKPKRSIVFLWVTGEEIGMFGSQYYAANPVFPLDKTVACINIDMAGRVFEPRDSVWKNSPKLVKDFDGVYVVSGKNNRWLVKASDRVCRKLGLKPDKSLPSNFLRSSDHYSFYSKGVPILNFATGWHADYHKPTDEVSKINFGKMKRMAELGFLVGYDVANRF